MKPLATGRMISILETKGGRSLRCPTTTSRQTPPSHTPMLHPYLLQTPKAAMRSRRSQHRRRRRLWRHATMAPLPPKALCPPTQRRPWLLLLTRPPTTPFPTAPLHRGALVRRPSCHRPLARPLFTRSSSSATRPGATPNGSTKRSRPDGSRSAHCGGN